MRAKALFLDRDGVINVDHGYVCHPDNFHFIDGIFELVRFSKMRNYKTIVITNQAGIGRGYYSEADFLALTEWMCAQFKAADASIDKVYFSPFHPTAGLGQYLRDHFSRKPNPGMILSAEEDLELDLHNSILIGDKASDIHAGFRAGIGTLVLYSNKVPESLRGTNYSRISRLVEAMTLFPA
jgi:D-glycero-D-manno-heptose 1,7-bisphosphate phosphatase